MLLTIEPEGEKPPDQLTTLAGLRIRERFLVLLRQKGLQQIDLAREVGVDQAYISRVVHGLQLPPPHMRIKMARALDIDSGLLWPVEEAGK